MAKKHSHRFVELVDDARSRIRETTPEEVQLRLAAGERLALVDTREADEYARGRLPGAVHLSKGVIERDVEEHFPELDREVILYCGGGYRSALAADNLRRMGYTQVVSMDGGWRRWTELGYPTEG